MTTITEIIARLGHECGLPWAEPYTKNVVDHGTHVVTTYVPKVIPPTLAEWQTEHEHEHPGEPGPVASWTSEDGRVSWEVASDYGAVYCSVRVGGAEMEKGMSGGWRAVNHSMNSPTADWAEAVRLMQAADGGG